MTESEKMKEKERKKIRELKDIELGHRMHKLRTVRLGDYVRCVETLVPIEMRAARTDVDVNCVRTEHLVSADIPELDIRITSFGLPVKDIVNLGTKGFDISGWWDDYGREGIIFAYRENKIVDPEERAPTLNIYAEAFVDERYMKYIRSEFTMNKRIDLLKERAANKRKKLEEVT